MTTGFLAACNVATIYDLSIGQRVDWLRMLGVASSSAYELSNSGMRCECGRYASALARYELVMVVGHASVQFDWLCAYCAMDADSGMQVIWLAR